MALCGPMGAGKTSVGTLVASRIDVPFIDTDATIERTTGHTIASLIEHYGEPYFRTIERDAVLAALADPAGGVFALGGGAVTADDVATRLADDDVLSVYLSARPETSARRALADGRASRPLLGRDGDPVEILARLLGERHERYASCDVRIETDDRAVGDVVDDVLAAIRAR